MTEGAALIYQYKLSQLLSKMGYSLDVNELEDYEARAFLLIENEFNRLKSDDMKRSSRRRA